MMTSMMVFPILYMVHLLGLICPPFPPLLLPSPQLEQKRIGSPSMLGAQPADILKDAAQEVIVILKDAYMKDPEKHASLSKLLTGKPANKSGSGSGGMTSESYANFVTWGKQINDFNTADDEEEGTDDKGGGEGGGVDEDMGVAVVFDDSDDEGSDDSGEGVGEVVDSSSSSDDDDSDGERDQGGGGGDDGDGKGKGMSDEMEGDEQHVTLGDGRKHKKKKNKRRRDTNNSNSSDDSDDEGPTPKKEKLSAKKELSVHDIDAHWLQRQLSAYYDDANVSSKVADDALEILAVNDLRECENKLLVLLGFELFDLIKLLLANRLTVWGCIRLKRAQDDDEKKAIEDTLKADPSGQGKKVWHELFDKASAEHWAQERLSNLASRTKQEAKQLGSEANLKAEPVKSSSSGDKNLASEAHTIDLDSLAFREGSRIMSNKTCELPKESWRAMKKGYEEVHVPAIRSVAAATEKLMPVSDLPKWTHAAFAGMDKLNRVQSKMCESALYSSENLLLCAPTGAGKTNVAMLTMLNVIGQHRRDSAEGNGEGDIDLQGFKIVYVAPMKALVQEVVKNFSKRLSSYGIQVKELSGDSSLTRMQISETQVLVTTPEKWDIITRQGEGRAYTQLVRLMIIDEIHLLHDDRGPVLENLVSRTIRQMEATQEPVRLVGLSATLPNYGDVATFLRVKHDKGLFFFDHSYRPVPLQQQYIGITERNAFKRHQLQNDICYEKALQQRKNGQQMLIFVHSRAECGKTAKALRDLALERDELEYFVREGAATQEILKEELGEVKHSDLKDVLTYGFAIHHAGMARSDRELVEDLFADRHIGVLCCTATLAWGVNLPAHAVIIKGTQIYDPAKGKWAELSPLDILQMLGRAGRPQYDTEGEGILMTQHSELQYYLSLMNLQLPVESQLIPALPNHLNAEVVLGNIQTLSEAVDWLSYSFLYVRMLRNPSLYGIINPEETLKKDPTLRQRRLDLVHSAALVLEKSNLLKYDRSTGNLQATPLGKVSSLFYISHTSMATYTRHLRPTMSDIELLRLFSLSEEFAHITVREEEKLELAKLAQRVPIPVKESPSEPSAKVNILLQAYISNLKLEGFALMADMAFVQQSAARIMRALFEISLRRNWSHLTKLTLAFSNMVSHKLWKSQSPLRQFPGVPDIVCRKLERKSDIEWARYSDLSPRDLGELVGVPKMGRNLHKLVHQFPKLEVAAHVQPLTRSLLKIELTLTPDFEYDTKVHGFVQLFHIIVEDVNGEVILHHELFNLRSTASQEEHALQFSVPILDPLPPQYFLRVLSDRWLHSETSLPISFHNLILPAKFPPPTELLELQPLPVIALGNKSLTDLYKGMEEFNSIQTQTFAELFKTDRNVLVCAPTGSGKTVCAEFALLRMLTSDPNGKCVYTVAKSELVLAVYQNWSSRFGNQLGVKVGCLTGDTASDLKTLKESQVVVSSINHWDALSRRWRQRKAVQAVTLFLMDELHLLGGADGPTMEVVLSRMRYLSTHLNSAADDSDNNKKKTAIRLVGLGSSMANAKEVAEWMGVANAAKSLFAFSSKHRPVPLEVYLQSFDTQSFSSRLLGMAKPVYNAVKQHCASHDENNNNQGMIFVPSRRQAQLTAIDLITYGETLGSNATAEGHVSMFISDPTTAATLAEQSVLLKEPALQQVVAAGVGFLHEGMLSSDWTTVMELYSSHKLRVLVCPFDLCWKLSSVKSHLVVLMETQYYDGSLRQHVDYPIADMLQMMGQASRPAPLTAGSGDSNDNGKCVILCHAPKKDYLKKLLLDPLPIESHLNLYLHDHVNSEVVTKTIGEMQDAVDYITWTFLYRRLTKNPNYYNLQGTSPTHLNEYVSDMVETVISDLEESKCCEVSEESGDVTPLNLGMIAAYYYIQYTTIELMASSVTQKTKVRGIMEILSASTEYSVLPIRQGEEKQLRILARKLTYKLPAEASYNDPNTKALVLLQCHFSRTPLPSAELRLDQQKVLKDSIKLLQAVVDVISSNGWLKPALAAMEVSQMAVQAIWNKDHVLKQIPHFSKEMVDRCDAYKGEDGDKIESIFDILSLEDDVRNDLLKLSDDKMADVAVFCNNYPNIEVSFKVQDADDVAAGDPVQIMVTLEREVDDDEEEEEDDELKTPPQYGVVSAPLFPSSDEAPKREGWWIVVGDTSTNSILSLKRVSLERSQKIGLEFMAPDEAGDYNLTLFCMSDSYLGCDQEYEIPLNVAAAASDDEENGSGSDSDGASGSGSD
jgi:pre-mRNA-splicing helicase BRR2